MSFEEDKIVEFMRPRKVRDIPGVGGVQEQLLAGLGIKNCEDLVKHAEAVYVNMTETTFEFLIKSAMGISRTRHEEGGGSISKRSCSVSKSFKPIVRKEQYIHHFK